MFNANLFTSVSRHALRVPNESGAMVICLPRYSHDVSPVVRPFIEKVKAAVTSGQKVIGILGEVHPRVQDVSMSRLLTHAYKADPDLRDTALTMALEMHPNLVEQAMIKKPCFFEGWQIDVSRALGGMAELSCVKPDLYGHIQNIAHQALKFEGAPFSNFSNMQALQEMKIPTAFVDMPRDKTNAPDILNPQVSDFIQTQWLQGNIEDDFVLDGLKEMRLRNIWMAQECKKILDASPVVFLKTGLFHVGGKKGIYAYEDSLHHIFTIMARGEDMKVITLLPELEGQSYDETLSRKALAQMDNEDMVVVRQGCATRHIINTSNDKSAVGTMAKEISAYSKILCRSAKIQEDWNVAVDRKKYEALQDDFKAKMVECLSVIVQDYAP